MKRISKVSLLIVLLMSAFSYATNAQEIIVKVRPRHATVVRTVAPGPRYVWVGEEWTWRGGRYEWAGGHWVLPPRRGGVWVPGHWRQRPHGWVWVQGHWRYRHAHVYRRR